MDGCLGKKHLEKNMPRECRTIHELIFDTYAYSSTVGLGHDRTTIKARFG